MENFNISDFITMTANGVNIASFSDIRGTLITRYKQVYGSDIDLSTASADGIFVNDLALIMNHILQSFLLLYSNLNVQTASGIYLDALCNLSNVVRKQATYSNASIQVTNVGNSDITNLTNPVFVDQAGNEWVYNGSISLAANETIELTVTCTTLGPISAPAGWINQTLNLTDLSVVQTEDANVGSNEETDDELRSRRNQSSGAAGTTVLESITGALLNLSGMKDVYIYNNNTNSPITSKDGTTIPAHSIYVIVRNEAGITISDSSIGDIIHEKLTPGISTSASGTDGTDGTAKSYTYVSSDFASIIVDAGTEIFWKQAKPIAPQIDISFTARQYFTTDEFPNIANTIMKYLNELPISTDLVQNEILVEAIYADPLFKSKPTYMVNSVTISESTNKDTYYNYTQFSYTQEGSVYTLSLS